MTNPYCETLTIDPPRLEAVRTHREANVFGLLIVALLERGGPMTLAEVAARFNAAGVAPTLFALASLKRCRPARAPVYRDGDHYSLARTADLTAASWAIAGSIDQRPSASTLTTWRRSSGCFASASDHG